MTLYDVLEITLQSAYRNSPTLFRTAPSQTPYDLLFPKIGVRNPHSKLHSRGQSVPCYTVITDVTVGHQNENHSSYSKLNSLQNV